MIGKTSPLQGILLLEKQQQKLLAVLVRKFLPLSSHKASLHQTLLPSSIRSSRTQILRLRGSSQLPSIQVCRTSSRWLMVLFQAIRRRQPCLHCLTPRPQLPLLHPHLDPTNLQQGC